MLTETCLSGQRVTKDVATARDAALITHKGLNSWVREEFKLMIIFITCISKCALINSEGKPFGQALNDCDALKNRRKCMSMGLEMVDSNLKCNFGTCLEIERIKDGAYESGNDTLSKMFIERVGFKNNIMWHTTTSDRAAKGVTTMISHNEDVCDIRDCYNIGRSDIVYLIKTRNKLHINQFPQIVISAYCTFYMG